MFLSKVSGIFSRVTSIVIGIIFIVVGLIFFLKFDPDAYDMQTTGVITEIEEHYELIGDDNELMHDVYIDYTVNGEKYEHAPYFSYNSGMKVGDEVEFYYMSEDPAQIAGSDKNATPWFGLGFAVIGFGLTAVTVIKMLRGRLA